MTDGGRPLRPAESPREALLPPAILGSWLLMGRALRPITIGIGDPTGLSGVGVALSALGHEAMYLLAPTTT